MPVFDQHLIAAAAGGGPWEVVLQPPRLLHQGHSGLSHCPPVFRKCSNQVLYRPKAAPRGLDLPNAPWPLTHLSLHHHCLPGIHVFFPVHRYLAKMSLSVIMYVSGSVKGEKLSAPLQSQQYTHFSLCLSYSLAPENALQIQNMYRNEAMFSLLSENALQLVSVYWVFVFTKPEGKSSVWHPLSLTLQYPEGTSSYFLPSSTLLSFGGNV